MKKLTVTQLCNLSGQSRRSSPVCAWLTFLSVTYLRPRHVTRRRDVRCIDCVVGVTLLPSIFLPYGGLAALFPSDCACCGRISDGMCHRCSIARDDLLLPGYSPTILVLKVRFTSKRYSPISDSEDQCCVMYLYRYGSDELEMKTLPVLVRVHPNANHG
jgi:hypothetical protein